MPRLRESDLKAFIERVMLLHVRSDDGSGERKIRLETAEIACHIVGYAFHNFWPLPEVEPTPEGEVEFTWWRGAQSLTFTVTPEDIVVWVARTPNGVAESGSLAFEGDDSIRRTAVVINEWLEGEKRGRLPQ